MASKLTRWARKPNKNMKKLMDYLLEWKAVLEYQGYVRDFQRFFDDLME